MDGADPNSSRGFLERGKGHSLCKQVRGLPGGSMLDFPRAAPCLTSLHLHWTSAKEQGGCPGLAGPRLTAH